MAVNRPRIPRRPVWCTGPVLVLLFGAFVSCVGVLFVAPYLSLYLHERAGLSATTVGLLLGLSYWATRVSGIVAGALTNRLGPRAVMLLGNGLRTGGYLLLITDSVPLLAAALLIVGVGSGIFFPVSKGYLLRLVDEEHQLRAIAVRNVFANAGVAVGPLAGLLVFVQGPGLLFTLAAGIFGVLTVLLLRLPRVVEDTPVPRYWRAAARLAVRRSVVLVMLATALLGLAIVQLESAFPMLVARGPSTALVSALFLVNALVVIVAQPVMVKAVSALSSRGSMAGGFALFAVSYAVLSVPSGLWPLWLAAVVVFSLAEVWVSLWIDDRVRREGAEEATTIYGVSGVSDACGGLGGAFLGTVLVGTGTGALPGLDSAYWLLGLLVLLAVAGMWAAVPTSWAYGREDSAPAPAGVDEGSRAAPRPAGAVAGTAPPGGREAAGRAGPAPEHATHAAHRGGGAPTEGHRG